jgi:hypothetical protein
MDGGDCGRWMLNGNHSRNVKLTARKVLINSKCCGMLEKNIREYGWDLRVDNIVGKLPSFLMLAAVLLILKR